MKFLVSLIAGIGMALPALADTYVPGTSNPWLAGMPEGTEASFGDQALTHSPVELSLSGMGGALSFNALGSVRNGPCCAWRDPDGGEFFTHYVGAEHGISDINAPINALVGVFLADWSQVGEPVTEALDFASIGLDFGYLAPQIGQVFFIGDGVTSDGLVQQFGIPVGATRLFLGTMDGYTWNDNDGGFWVTVSAVPEPSSWALLAAGLGLIGLTASRQRGDMRLTTGLRRNRALA